MARKTIEEALKNIISAYDANPHPCHYVIREAIEAGRKALSEDEEYMRRCLENSESGDDPDLIGY